MNTTKWKFLERKATLLLLLAVPALFNACKKGSKENPGPRPEETKLEILSVSPTQGRPGMVISITGKNFSPEPIRNDVRFTGSVYGAEVVSAAATELKVKVPYDAETGKITVIANNRKDTSDAVFTVLPEQLAITDFTPKSGPFGTPVIIKGNQFGDDIKVFINGIEARVTQKSQSEIHIVIPVNTTLNAHKITVVSDNTTLETAEVFTVTADGPYARWENKNISLLPPGANAFTGGLSFVYKNKIYWGFTALVSTESEADYAVFDPAQPGKGWTLQSRPPADMASAAWRNAVSVVHNGKVYMGTGITTSSLNAWWRFDPETNSSTRLTDFPLATSGALAFVLNNNLYAGFGIGNNELYRFDPVANSGLGSWHHVATGGFSSLHSGNAFVLGDEVFMGRALPVVNHARNAIYKFSASGLIERVADMADDLPSLSTPVFTIGNRGYLVANKNVWEYTPDAMGGKWRAVLASNDAPVMRHVAVVTVNGVEVVYGWTASGALYEFKIS